MVTRGIPLLLLHELPLSSRPPTTHAGARCSRGLPPIIPSIHVPQQLHASTVDAECHCLFFENCFACTKQHLAEAHVLCVLTCRTASLVEAYVNSMAIRLDSSFFAQHAQFLAYDFKQSSCTPVAPPRPVAWPGLIHAPPPIMHPSRSDQLFPSNPVACSRPAPLVWRTRNSSAKSGFSEHTRCCKHDSSRLRLAQELE